MIVPVEYGGEEPELLKTVIVGTHASLLWAGLISVGVAAWFRLHG